ncbi:MFS general substrate transporter [Gymnopus androsaceus JB14]|uniref:MFS general substrate transporter n=1 Tax=Gymnopus androsaceus JB14 TaxID=1447944 RepID=A0A6A4IB61_9AGAR|nr:MFS general substrate transporter [Gymnopus androsaceus JB14]
MPLPVYSCRFTLVSRTVRRRCTFIILNSGFGGLYMGESTVRPAPPYGLKWRSSYWFVTFVVGLGIGTDLLVYSVVVPVLPFQLEKLGYSAIPVRTSWLLFSYSAGLVVATLPVAIFSERYDARKAPLVLGIIILIGSQIMLMEAPVYWLMCLARILQGIGSTMVWVIGLALLCDTTPTKLVGRQLGIAMSGISIGFLVGPPVGGALYSRFGFRGPCIFGIIAAVLDLVGRLVVIERKEALYWDHDPLSVPEDQESNGNGPSQDIVQDSTSTPPTTNPGNTPEKEAVQHAPSPSFFFVIIQFAKSSRAVVATILTFVYGIVYTCIEPTLPLHMQSLWGFDSAKVGLLFLAAVIPTFFSGPITGIISDRYGPSWITVASFLCDLPWWGLMIIDGNLPLFIASFALSSFFIAGAISPLLAELAAVSRSIDGVGYAHVYAAFNLAYGIGSAAGPIVGGQIYYQVEKGWTALCFAGGWSTRCRTFISVFLHRRRACFRQTEEIFPRSPNYKRNRSTLKVCT